MKCLRSLNVLGALFLGASISWGQKPERLIEILPLLESNRTAGIQKLQQLFATTQNPIEKFDSALLLGSLPTDTLGTQTQSQFLEYLHSQPRLARESSDSQARIYRKLGDVRYELGQLKEARESYLKLKRLKNPVDVEYSLYRLGWIDVNEKNPIEALNQWMSIFDLNPKGGTILGNVIFRDLGRIWPEVVSGGQTQFDSKIAELTLNPESRDEFLFGLKLGIRFVSSRSAKDLENFRQRVRQGILSLLVLEGVAASEKLVLSGPCAVLDWFPVGLEKKSVDSPLVFESLVRCFRLPRGEKLKKELQFAFERLALNGRNRLPLAEIYFDQNQYSESCAEYSEASKEDPGLSGIVGSVARACEKSVLAAKNSKITVAQRQADLARIYDSFVAQAPKPLVGAGASQWVEVLEILLSPEAKNLIPQLNTNSRGQIIEAYLPPEKTFSEEKLEKRRIWIWTSFLNSEVDEIDPSGDLFRRYFEMLKWGQTPDAYSLAALALKKNRGDWIWKNRQEFRKALKIQPGFSSLLEEVSNQALRKALGEGGDLAVTGPEIEEILKILEALEKSEVQLSSQRDKIDKLPLDFLATDWAKDLKKLETLEQNSQRYLGVALNPLSQKFVNSLTSLVKKSQNLVSFVSEGPWYHKRMAQIATRRVTAHQKLAAQKIRKIEAPKIMRELEKTSFNQEMSKIASELETLGDQIRGPQSEQSPRKKTTANLGSISEEKPRVIDLGQENIESTVRQPGLKVIESESTLLKYLPQVFKSQFESLEKELTRPQPKFTGGSNEF